jgi:predicted GNAT family acetyltransferase
LRVSAQVREDAGVHFAVESDPVRFAARVMPFLERDVAHNVLATILLGVLESRGVGAPPILLSASDGSGEVAVVALRTPPLPMICTELSNPESDAARLLDAWRQVDPDVPGVNAPRRSARALAIALPRRPGQTASLRRATQLHALTRVNEPAHPAAGALRPAEADDDARLIEWTRRFGAETGSPVLDPRAAVGARRTAGHLWLWCDPDGEPVCMVGAHPPIARVPRVAPVYTPPEHRRRGYAGSAVAAVSHRLLERGARACILFTDQANPTSNRIYREVGYRPIAGWEEYVVD